MATSSDSGRLAGRGECSAALHQPQTWGHDTTCVWEIGTCVYVHMEDEEWLKLGRPSLHGDLTLKAYMYVQGKQLNTELSQMGFKPEFLGQ